MKILVIWEKFEEGTSLYEVETNRKKTVEKIKKASGKIVGLQNKDPKNKERAVWLSNYLSGKGTLLSIDHILEVTPEKYDLIAYFGYAP